MRAVTVDTSQANGPARLTMLVTAAGRSSSPAVVDLRPDPSTLHALAEQPLPLDEPSQWHLNLAGGGRQVNTKGTDGGVEFGFVFAAKGDNWAYPWVGFEPVRDFSAYDGLRFDYRSDPAAPGPIRLMLVEASGASYLAETSRPGARQWQTGTLLFQDMSCLSWMKPDPNGHLDLDQITALRFGCNCQSLSVALELRNLRLVRFTPR